MLKSVCGGGGVEVEGKREKERENGIWSEYKQNVEGGSVF